MENINKQKYNFLADNPTGNGGEIDLVL